MPTNDPVLYMMPLGHMPNKTDCTRWDGVDGCKHRTTNLALEVFECMRATHLSSFHDENGSGLA